MPARECYQACSDAWGGYVEKSLRDLIAAGGGQNLTKTFTVDQAPEAAFAAINDPRRWWSQGIAGVTDQLGAEWTYQYQDLHRCRFRITELVPGKRVVWHVVDSHLGFVADENEWTGTDVVFEIAPKGDQTEVRFTHVGVVPAHQCYEICSDAWSRYVTESLRDLIATGSGQPNPIEEIVTRARQMGREA